VRPNPLQSRRARHPADRARNPGGVRQIPEAFAQDRVDQAVEGGGAVDLAVGDAEARQERLELPAELLVLHQGVGQLQGPADGAVDLGCLQVQAGEQIAELLQHRLAALHGGQDRRGALPGPVLDGGDLVLGQSRILFQLGFQLFQAGFELRFAALDGGQGPFLDRGRDLAPGGIALELGHGAAEIGEIALQAGLRLGIGAHLFQGLGQPLFHPLKGLYGLRLPLQAKEGAQQIGDDLRAGSQGGDDGRIDRQCAEGTRQGVDCPGRGRVRVPRRQRGRGHHRAVAGRRLGAGGQGDEQRDR